VETTQIYLHADLRQKEEALAKVTPSDLPAGVVPARRRAAAYPGGSLIMPHQAVNGLR
jgi:hypothetical protein